MGLMHHLGRGEMPHATIVLVRCAAFAAALLCSFASLAANEKVTGVIGAAGHDGGYLQVNFTCFGLPTCTGLYGGVAQDSGCTNSLDLNEAVTITGLNLSQPGTFSGQITFQRDWNSNGPLSGAPINCTYTMRTNPFSLPYNGTWDGQSGTMSYTGTDEGGPFFVFGAFYADAVSTTPPVFDMETTGSITPTVANISATFQPRPQDVGTNASTFVFALAPATKVPNAAVTKETHLGLVARVRARDDPVPCVLAQLNQNGQLVGVTASSIQAYTSGVLSAQGQSVSVLNNVSTPAVAGATFFVGYGPNSSAMINGGVNRSAVTVPGADTCNPLPPQTGWWWNPLEGGRGFSIEVQGNNLFFAAFHYDANGRATWNVSPGPVSLGGSYFTSDLYDVTGGQTLGGAYRAPDAVKAGAITLSFSSPTQGTMTWPGGSVPIERQPLVPGGLEAPAQENVPETGWWWNPQESGRGFFIEWQKGYADIAGYMYDDQGRPTWYIAVYETPNARAFSGSWWTFANGQSMGGAYRTATRTSDNFAPLAINFTSATTAVMTLPNGRTTNLIRQRF
jgi:hypothetical protein